MGRAEQITRVVKSYDPKLYCVKHGEGKLCVYRKGTRLESYDVDGSTIHFVRPNPHLVFALTDNWKTHGQAVDWGTLPILARLKAIDLWNRDLAEECIQSTMKQTESNERQARNSTESFLREFRSQFARATNDVNTSTLAKKDNRRNRS